MQIIKKEVVNKIKYNNRLFELNFGIEQYVRFLINSIFL